MAKRSPSSDAVRTEWLRRIEAEYGFAAITQHLGLWLVQLGASPDLVRMSNRIVADELEHARLSHVTYRAAGGTKVPSLEQYVVVARPRRMANCGNHAFSLSKRQSEPGGFFSAFSAVQPLCVPHVDDEPALVGGCKA